MSEQELYRVYQTIREEMRDLGENIRPNVSSTSPAGIYDSGYEQALEEAVDILDKHFAGLQVDEEAHQANLEAWADDRAIEIWEASRPVTLVMSTQEEPF